MLNRLVVSSCDRTSALEALPGKFDTKRRSPSIFYLFTGQRARLKNFRIKSLLPSTDYYMTYEGSLTQPGCQESVTWILLNKPIYVNNDQVRLIINYVGDTCGILVKLENVLSCKLGSLIEFRLKILGPVVQLIEIFITDPKIVSSIQAPCFRGN